MLRLVLGLVIWGGLGLSLAEAQKSQPASAPVDVSQFRPMSGFFDVYWDAQQGKVWLKLDELDQPFLLVSSLATGLGSNPVGLDRGQLGQDRIVRFTQVGQRVFLIQPNLKYRATTDSAAEKAAIQESFAESVHWSGDIKTGSDNSRLVDLTSFLIRDAHDCIGSLEAAGQGSYRLDADRSFVYLPRTKAFPDNVEFEVSLTFASKKPGRLAERAAADGKSISLRQHHSWVRLPDDDYRPRRSDPRVGCFSVAFADYGVPLDRPLEQRFIVRHRLQKQNPQAERSPAKRPIVYYVDPGVPQPVRDALIEGASWWNEAFEEAGFENAFQVKVLPADADPMDVRYNVIQWVHRATRGWSYGQSVVDPRTGEIIKGHVLLGSLRVRQDRLLFEGLRSGLHDDLPPTSSSPVRACTCGLGHIPGEAYLSQLDPAADTIEVALARIRQLSAHEVGHTLGFAHNFAGSTYGDRASVMDYPAPRTRITDGRLDLSDAYGVGVGVWDKYVVQYAYSEFEEAQEAEALQQLVSQAVEKRYIYVTDADARPAGAAHPLGNLWDNGSDPAAALAHEMEVRKLALASFGAHVLPAGSPMSDLEKHFVPVYLHHRYQVDAAAKLLGGFETSYAVQGDGQQPVLPVAVSRQRQAAQELIKTITPDALVISADILGQLSPSAHVSASDRERFSTQTDPIFDPGTAMRVAATLTIANMLQPQRAWRLARQAGNWNLMELTDELIQATVESPSPSDAAELEARRIVQVVLVDQLMSLTESGSASHDARAVAASQLDRLQTRFQRPESDSRMATAHAALLSARIQRFLQRNDLPAKRVPPVDVPPGSPIGAHP